MEPESLLGEFEKTYAPFIMRKARQFWLAPHQIADDLRHVGGRHSSASPDAIVVSGETENLSVYFTYPQTTLVFTPFNHTRGNIVIQQAAAKTVAVRSSCLVAVSNSPRLLERLRLPKAMLINPAIKDVYPTPRLVLSTASLAGYLRQLQLADVRMYDMQLKDTPRSIIDALRTKRPRLIGISINFGQLSVAERLIEQIFTSLQEMNLNSIVVAGNVVASLAHKELLERFPSLVICNGEGEATIAELLSNSHAIDLARVPGITFQSGTSLITTAKKAPKMDDLPLPALDTVAGVVTQGGALTLETWPRPASWRNSFSVACG